MVTPVDFFANIVTSMGATRLVYRLLTFPPPTDGEVQAFIEAVGRGDFSAHAPDRRRNRPYLIFDNDLMVYAGGDRILVTEWLLTSHSLTELRRVSRRIIRDAYQLGHNEPLLEDEVEPVNFFVVDLPPEDFWPIASDRTDAYPDSTVELLATPSKVTARFYVTAGADTPLATVERVASSVCAGAGATVDAIEEVYRLSTDVGWCIEVGRARRGATAGDLIEVARACTAAIGALHGATFNRETIAALVRAGMSGVIAGSNENEWFEVKSQPWDLDAVAGKKLNSPRMSPGSRTRPAASFSLAQRHERLTALRS